MELSKNIEFLRGMSEKLKLEVEKEEIEVQEYLKIGRQRMNDIETKRQRMFLLEAAVNNLQSLLDETPEHVPTTADPWA